MKKYTTFAEKESYKSSLKVKIIRKLETIALLQVTAEVLHIVINP